MKTELTDLSPTRKELKIEIEPALVRSTYDRISEQYTRKITIPGFRPGHAPRSVVRSRFKKEIRSDVLREIIPDAINNAIDQHAINAIGEPNVELDNEEAALERLGEEPITVKVGLEVMPEITLDQYKGLEAARRVRPVTDDMIDKAIEDLRDGSASLEPVEDRGAELGDTVTVNARGIPVDQPGAEEIKVEDVEVELGGPGVQPEFTDNLQGARPDDKRSFVVEYPEDFSTPGLAGKKISYETDVTAVRRKVLPELDDEWAKSLGEESLATLKARIREDFENRATTEADHRLRGDVVQKLLDTHQFEVPESMIEAQTQQRLEGLVREMIGRGYDPRHSQLNWEGARAELKTQAQEDVRATLLLQKIAEAENITVSDEEIEAEIQAIVESVKQPLERVRAVLTKDGGERSIALRLRNRKALDLLIEKANVTDAEWVEPKADEVVEPKADEAAATNE